MSKSEELERLKAERDEINRKIRAMKTEGVVAAGNAKLSPKQSYAYRGSELWQVGYAVPIQRYGCHATQYRTMVTGTRKECIDSIPGIIKDLKDLYLEANRGAQDEGV